MILLAALASTAPAAEPSPAEAKPWPLWDGKETIAEYAKRVNLPPTETLNLGGGVKLELVLVPAGKFLMGTPEPESLWIGRGIVIAGGALAFALLVAMVVGMIRRRSFRPQFSLAGLLAFTAAMSIVSYGGVRWWQAERAWATCDKDEFPQHEVTLTHSFYMGKYEVTQAQYEKVMGGNPSCFKGARNPVDAVSWDDAQEFCKRVNNLPLTLPSPPRLSITHILSWGRSGAREAGAGRDRRGGRRAAG